MRVSGQKGLVGLTEDLVRKYVQMQEKEDTGQTKFEF